MADEAIQQGDTEQASDDTASTQSVEQTNALESEAVEKPVEQPTEAAKQETPAEQEGILSRQTEDTEVPESYEWTLPEGAEMTTEELEELSTMAKEAKLSADEAPKAYEFAQKIHQRIEQEIEAATKVELDKLKTEAKADWEKDPNHAEKTLLMEKFLKKHDAVNHFIDSNYETDTKLMNLFAAAGRLISEDSLITGVDGATEAHNPYPNSPEWK
jgi:hypothetical protein